MNWLFNAALFARTNGSLVATARCLSSGLIGLSLRQRRRIDHHAAFITAENKFLLTRFRATCCRCYSTRKASSRVGKSKTKKSSDSKVEKMLDDEKNAFFVVRKGDLVGVYKNLSDCQAQVGSSVYSCITSFPQFFELINLFALSYFALYSSVCVF